MRKTLLFIVCLTFSAIATAQILQHGYVKTKGVLQPDGSVVPGIRVPGVTVSIRGTNKVVSQQQGVFSFTPPAQTFFLSGITKQGYVLSDPDAANRTYSYTRTPMEIVIEDVNQRRKELKAARDSISQNMNKQMKLRQKEMARLAEQNRITQAERDSLQTVLEMLLEANEIRLPALAHYFVSTDYDNVDEKRRQINAYILSGQLEKADSVINSKGDIHLRMERIRQEETMTTLRKADLAEDFYSKFVVFSSKFERDSAYHYLLMRASLDTLNVEWQLTAGMYAEDNMADYDAAYNYYERAIRMATMHANPYLLSEAYNDMGALYANLRDYDKALDYFDKALMQISEDTLQEHKALIASAYENIAAVYSDCRMYNESMEYHTKALEMKKRVFGKVSEDVFISLINIGSMYSEMKDYQQSFEYYQQAKEIAGKIFSHNDPMNAHVYNGLGVCYSNLGELGKAIECYTGALNIRKNAFGDKHPILGAIYSNLGMMYIKMGDYAQAKEHFDRAVQIWIAAYGEDNSRLVELYGNIALMYESQGETDTAIRHYEEALRVSKKLYGNDSPITEEVLPSLYLALESLVGQSPTEENRKKLEAFMADKVPACVVISGGPAHEQGLRGKCVVMEYCGWTIESDKAMFNLIAPTAGKPKDMVLMHDGQIERYHFENKIGVQWVLWIVTADEKQKMIEVYRKWKKNLHN